ncbi:MAG: hypothetical protein ACQESG_06135 [Nanobdellota archaeon]
MGFFRKGSAKTNWRNVDDVWLHGGVDSDLYLQRGMEKAVHKLEIDEKKLIQIYNTAMRELADVESLMVQSKREGKYIDKKTFIQLLENLKYLSRPLHMPDIVKKSDTLIHSLQKGNVGYVRALDNAIELIDPVHH